MSSIQIVEDWVASHDELTNSYDLPEPPLEDIQELLEHAKKSDDYVRKMYQIVGFMFKDAAEAMRLGRIDKYREMELDDMFTRVHEILELPMPLDMAPKLEDIPDAANDIPSIILVN